TPDGTKAYVAYSSGLGVITTSTNTLSTTVSMSGADYASVSADGTYVYVVSDTASTLTTVATSTNTVVSTASTGGEPFWVSPGNVALTPANFSNVSNASLSTLYTSNTITLAGTFSNATVTCKGTCSAISINGGSFVAGPVTNVNPGNTIA